MTKDKGIAIEEKIDGEIRKKMRVGKSNKRLGKEISQIH